MPKQSKLPEGHSLVNFVFPNELKAEIKRVAKEDNTDVSKLMRSLAEAHIKKHDQKNKEKKS